MRIELGGATEILIGRGLPDPVLPVRDRSSVVVVTQPGAIHVAREAASAIGSSTVVELPDGEEAKSSAGLDLIYAALDREGVRRDGAVVGVGGGSVTDVAGFAAATWLRGIESAYLPTTLLAAVDAAIGGKTGINFRGKNLIGAFWHPSRVIIDIQVLEELPAPVARDGWAEILKAALLADAALVDAIEGGALDLEESVGRAVRIKADIVAEDFRETARRAHLNLGHTIGHAVEVAAGLTHGQAVGLGLVAEAAAAHVDRGFRHVERVRALVEGLGLPSRVAGVDRTHAEALMQKDKKADAGGLRMVLLDDIGRPVVGRPSAQAIDAAWNAIGV